MADTHVPARPGARRILGRLLGTGIVLGTVVAVAVALLQWQTRPQTDDATVRANFIGIAPQVSGHIAKLLVHDNQKAAEGDLLFLIDPRPYEIALEQARASLALTRKEVDSLKSSAAAAVAGVSKAEAQLRASAAEVNSKEIGPVEADATIARLEAQRVSAEATLRTAEAQFKNVEEHVKRLEPLLPQQFVTADQVEDARTKQTSAAISVEQARTAVLASVAALDEAKARKRGTVAALAATRAQHLGTEAALLQARSDRSRAESNVGETDGINARVAAAEAAVHSAELNLSYCSVRAPFTGLVVNLNISNGAYARAGAEVFTLVDTRTWYVVANFRETQLRHIFSGATADLYLQSQPGKRFQGTVVGLGWAVAPENGGSAQACRVSSAHSTGSVSRRAFRCVSRWRIRTTLSRIGASAVATIRNSPPGVSP